MHRDLKPLNLLLTKNLEVRMTDFGISTSFFNLGPARGRQGGLSSGPAPPPKDLTEGAQDRTAQHGRACERMHQLPAEPWKNM